MLEPIMPNFSNILPIVLNLFPYYHLLFLYYSFDFNCIGNNNGHSAYGDYYTDNRKLVNIVFPP